MTDDIKGKVTRGFFWVLIEKFSTQFVGFAISLVLARLLCPAVYGVIALTTIFITISKFLIDSGFAAALVQKKDVRHVDMDSVFYFNVAIATGLYAILYVAAPAIANFYHEVQLSSVLRVLALSLIVNSINAVQQVEISRKMLFNLGFRVSFIKCCIQGIIGISMAVAGYGVWALVVAEVASSAVLVIVTWFWVGWRPQLAFSFSALSGLMRFGWKIFVSGIWGIAYSNVYGVLVGRLYTSTDLGLYNKGNVFPNTAMSAVQSSVIGVVFPAFSKVQDDAARMLGMIRKLVRCFTFFSMPILGLLAGCADPLVRVLLGEKWIGAIPYLQIGCLVYCCFPLSSVPTQAIKAIGRSDLFLLQSFICGMLILGSIVISFKGGPLVMALAVAFATGPLDRIVAAVYSKYYLRYGYWAQLQDIAPGCVLSAIVCLASLWISQSIAGCSQMIRLAGAIATGVCAGAVCMFFSRPRPMLELVQEPAVRAIVNQFFASK